MAQQELILLKMNQKLQTYDDIVREMEKEVVHGPNSISEIANPTPRGAGKKINLNSDTEGRLIEEKGMRDKIEEINAIAAAKQREKNAQIKKMIQAQRKEMKNQYKRNRAAMLA